MDDEENGHAREHTVKREHAVAAARHVAQKGRDREPAAHGRRKHARDERRAESLLVQHVRHLEDRGRRDDRHAHKKAEDRGALAISAGARNVVSAYLSSNKPAMPPGIVAITSSTTRRCDSEATLRVVTMS